MPSLKLVFRKRIVTRWLALRARLAALLGRREEAERLLVRAVELAPASFSLHLRLGRMHLSRGRRRAALNEFSVCYHLDALRFMKQSISGTLQEEVALEAQMPDEPELAVPEPGGGRFVEVTPEEAEILLEGTDFSSIEELRRLTSLEPISAEQVEKVDLDRLLVQLTLDHQRGGNLGRG